MSAADPTAGADARADGRLALFAASHPAVEELLRRALHPGEKVRLLTTGWRSFFVDDVFLAVPTLLGNRTLVVGTDRRLLLVTCANLTLELRGPIEEVPRDSVLAVMSVPFLSVFTTGGTIRLIGVPGVGKRALALPHDPTTERSGRPRPLCPSCFVALDEPEDACPRCRTPFRSPVGAGLRSLAVPGWGDAYLLRPGVAAMTVLATAFLWGNVALFLQAAARSTAEAAVVQTLAGRFLLLALAAHVGAALVSFVRGRRGPIAADGRFPAEERAGGGPTLRPGMG